MNLDAEHSQDGVRSRQGRHTESCSDAAEVRTRSDLFWELAGEGFPESQEPVKIGISWASLATSGNPDISGPA